MTNAEYIKTIPTLTNKELLEELDYCGYDSYYRTIREPVIEEITKRLNRIAELEKENAELEAEVKEWKDKADLWCKTANLKDHNIMINKELEKENAELKCECKRCVYSDCPCILSDYGKDRNGICDHFKDVFDENAELKERLKEHESIGNAQFWKNVWSWKTKAEQLTKAKELIEDMYDAIPSSHSDYYKDVMERAEQFLNSEVEK